MMYRSKRLKMMKQNPEKEQAALILQKAIRSYNERKNDKEQQQQLRLDIEFSNDDKDPITFELLSSYPRESLFHCVAMDGGDEKRKVMIFHAPSLAECILSTGKPINPLNRKEFNHIELRRLDDINRKIDPSTSFLVLNNLEKMKIDYKKLEERKQSIAAYSIDFKDMCITAAKTVKLISYIFQHETKFFESTMFIFEECILRSLYLAYKNMVRQNSINALRTNVRKDEYDHEDYTQVLQETYNIVFDYYVREYQDFCSKTIVIYHLLIFAIKNFSMLIMVTENKGNESTTQFLKSLDEDDSEIFGDLVSRLKKLKRTSTKPYIEVRKYHEVIMGFLFD